VVGRTDLPGGSWEVLERTIRERLFPLGDAVRVLPGHGPATTIGAERRDNPFVGERAGQR
jgi:hydroxyacylglutathione hydrolase